MSIVLSDAGRREHLMPLTITRPIGALRPGIFTMKEAWEARTGCQVAYHTHASLSAFYEAPRSIVERVVYGGLLCTAELADRVMALKQGQMLTLEGRPIACCGVGLTGNELDDPNESDWERVEVGHLLLLIDRPWHVFQHCGQAIAADLQLVTKARSSGQLSPTNTVIGDASAVFLEEGAQVEACTLNTTTGPIYLGKNSVLMEGCHIRGPFALGEKSQVKMAAKIYGPSAFGPQCRVGGEVSNSVLLGYTNKGHDGFLGNSVLGEWCNLGADTNNSNLKNNYGEVRVYSYAENKMTGTGLQFCGLIMGDHSKAGINTMFNTGTVVGVCANIFGGGFPPKHIPSFAWGGADGFVPYEMEKALTTAHNVMTRRDVDMNEEHIALLQHIKNDHGLGG